MHWFRFTALLFLILAAAGCGPVMDSEQVRTCRLVPQALHPDGTQIREIRVAPVPGERSAIRIDYAAQEPGSVNRAHFATCIFGGTTFERDRLDLTALETAYKEMNVTVEVIKDMKLEWPRAETKTHWITMGFDEDLNEAMKIATRESVEFLASQKMVPMSRDEAYALTSMAADCRVTEVVDIRKGVHCMIPKSIFTKK